LAQISVKHKFMTKRRRKRGRPATGADPILGVRVPLKIIRQIDGLAEALSIDRSQTVRRLLVTGLERDAWLMRTGKRKGVIGRYINVVAAAERAKAAEESVKRARPNDKVGRDQKSSGGGGSD
jgi:hypothetical protein